MNQLLVSPLNFDFFNRYDHMTIEGFLGMCAFILILLLINRLLGKRSTNGLLLKNKNLSNYSLSFTPEENFSNMAVGEREVSLSIKILAFIMAFILIVTPLSEIILPPDIGFSFSCTIFL